MYNNMENSEKTHEHINHEETSETWNSMREEGEGKETTLKFESDSFSEEGAKALKYKQMSVLMAIAGMALQESNQAETTVEEVLGAEDEESEWEEDLEEWEESDYAVTLEDNEEEQILETISIEPENNIPLKHDNIIQNKPENNIQNKSNNINSTNTFYDEENISNNTNVHTNNLINNITHSINAEKELVQNPCDQDEGGNHLAPLDLELNRILNWGYTDVIKRTNGGITVHETQRSVLDMIIYFETKNYSQRIFIEELNKKKKNKK